MDLHFLLEIVFSRPLLRGTINQKNTVVENDANILRRECICGLRALCVLF